MKIAHTSFALIITFFFIACYKDDDSLDSTFLPDPPRQIVESHLTGFVHRLDGSRVKDVEVKWHDQTLITDAQGYFTFDKINAWQDSSFVKYGKQGYFYQILPIDPLAGQTLLLYAPLLPTTRSATFESWKTNEIQLEEIEIQIPANSLVIPATSQPYTGMYTVSLDILNDEEVAALFEKVSLFRADNFTNNPTVILPYQMILFQLTDGTGHNLESGQTYDITLNLPFDIQGKEVFIQQKSGQYHSVPFNEVHSRRIELNTDFTGHILIGQKVEAKVLEGAISTNSDFPLSHVQIEVTNTDNRIKKSFSLSSGGTIRTWLPAGSFNLSLIDICGNRFDEFKISLPLTEFIDIKTNQTIYQYLFYSGIVRDCSRSIKSGFLEIGTTTKNSSLIPLGPDGQFSFFNTACETNSVEITGFEFGESAPVLITKTKNSGQGRNITLSACEQDPNTEATFSSSSHHFLYRSCEAIITDKNGSPSQIQILVTSTHGSEFHRFKLNDANGALFWSSPSTFTDREYTIVQIPDKPLITEYVHAGKNYVDLTFSDVTVDVGGGQKDKANISYNFLKN
ncbi:MAG: hypothetical protein R3275_07275 [Saprospiraceae bacterium]|nr:hypothetical protein [Saprospiraceae bacterium]